jgi:hypothetical protein
MRSRSAWLDRTVQLLATTTMPFVKTPTSSLTGDPIPHVPYFHVNTTIVIELLVNKLWYRSKAKIKQYFSRLFGGIQETSTARSSPVPRLPQELVDVIISYFIYNTRALKACSLTCYSWYIAAVPHLHHSLTTDNWSYFPGDGKYWWPNPLKKSYHLGLLPLVQRLRIRLCWDATRGFGPNRLGICTLRYFSALTNLQELGIDDLQVSSFMPDIQRCFGHFSPTLRSLALREPKGSCRQILYFIGLFPNLQDLKLNYLGPKVVKEDADDTTLVPPSVPPLRGRLTVTYFTRKKLVEEMISLFGGLRFRYMDLYGVKFVWLLLDACAETLERLRLYPSDPHSEDFFSGAKKQGTDSP